MGSKNTNKKAKYSPGYPMTSISGLSREQVSAILEKLAEAESVADSREEIREKSGDIALKEFYRGEGRGLFRAACLIREIIRGEVEMCEHGVCQCGSPVTQDSCPKCGAWNDIHGRR